jgi:ubiquinone/menaquinone biosynthesis C-methylase UbiE
MKGRSRRLFPIAFLFILGLATSLAFSEPKIKSQSDIQPTDSSSRRREFLWKLPLGVVGSYAYGRLAFNALSVQGIKYPEEHEKRVQSTITTTLFAARSSKEKSPLRVLEVGAGKDLRLLRRGLYEPAFDELHKAGVQQVDLVALDIVSPSASVVAEAQKRYKDDGVQVSFLQASIEAPLNYPDGYFDAIVCCLTLCSVFDQTKALQEMNRLLRPNGGCFGYVEHVAVNAEEPNRFLEFQQRALDPLQQTLADNCHLHRYTQEAIVSEFNIGLSSKELARERFLVNSMWPVTCQSCGVVQKGPAATTSMVLFT